MNIVQIALAGKAVDSELNKTGNLSSVEDLLELNFVRITMICLYVVVITISVLGNLFLIIFIIKSATFTNGNRFTLALILNLAVCDLIRSATLSPIKLFEYFSSIFTNDESDNFCDITSFFFLLFTFAGFHAVVAISVERLILICYPFKARLWLTTKTVSFVLIVVWICAFAVSFLISFETLHSVKVSLSSGKELDICGLNTLQRESTTQAKIDSTIAFVIYYFVPVIIITISYAKIFRILIRKNSSTELHKVGDIKLMSESSYQIFKVEKSANSAALNLLKTRRCLAKMMLAIAICFALFNGPTFFVYLGINWGLNIQNNSMFWILVIKFLPNLSSVINPIIYCTKHRILTKNFWECHRDRSPTIRSTVSLSTKVYEI